MKNPFTQIALTLYIFCITLALVWVDASGHGNFDNYLLTFFAVTFIVTSAIILTLITTLFINHNLVKWMHSKR